MIAKSGERGTEITRHQLPRRAEFGCSSTEDRHSGREAAILAARQAVYEEARSERPERWSGRARNWDPITEVHLNHATPTVRQENRAAA